MVRIEELADGDLERIQEAREFLKQGKTEDEVKKVLTEQGFIPYHVQFIVDIASGRIPLEHKASVNETAIMEAKEKSRKQNMVIGLIIGGVALAVLAGLVYFQVLGT